MTRYDFSIKLMSLENSLQSFAYHLTSDKEDAKDLLQDTFLKALIYMEQFEDNTNLKAWVFTIMRNIFINNYRRNIKHNKTFDTIDNQFLINSRTDPMTPETLYSQSEINSKVNLLQFDFRIPFQMLTSGYKYKEIADKLNLKIGTVKSRISYSRKKLMAVLKDYNT